MSSHTGAIGGVTEETRRKQSDRQKGEKNHFHGKKHSEETIVLMKHAASNRKRKTLT
jgi:hypothetical protein